MCVYIAVDFPSNLHHNLLMYTQGYIGTYKIMNTNFLYIIMVFIANEFTFVLFIYILLHFICFVVQMMTQYYLLT